MEGNESWAGRDIKQNSMMLEPSVVRSVLEPAKSRYLVDSPKGL